MQDQVLRLLADIRNRLGLTVLFITHDLRVAAQVCDSIVVMHKGRVVESGPVADVYARPAHAYTQALLAAVPGRQWSHDNDACGRHHGGASDTDSTMTLPAAPAAPGLQAVSLGLREGRISAVELTQAALARISALEPRLQAFMHLDAARAIAHAQAIDGLRAAGVDLGPLMGVPVAVKDLFSVDGMPTTAGSRLDVQDLVPPQGSFVDALQRAGCVILGKTRTTEFALGGFNLDRPPPWNPCDAQRAAHDRRVEPRLGGGDGRGAGGLHGRLRHRGVGALAGRPVRRGRLQGQQQPLALRRRVPAVARAGQHRPVHAQRARRRAGAMRRWVGTRCAAPPGIDTLTLAVPTLHFMDQLDEPVLRCFEAAVARLRAAGARIVNAEDTRGRRDRRGLSQPGAGRFAGLSGA